MEGKDHLNISCENCIAKKSNLLGMVEARELSELSRSKSCTFYNKKQLLFKEGKWPSGVFCIHKGKVKVFKLGPDGKDQIITIAHEGDLLGYRALLSEDVFPVSAESLEDSHVCFIPKNAFLEMIEKNDDLHHQLLKDAYKELAKMTKNITDLAQKSVKERLAATLIILSDIYDHNGKERSTVEINLGREDLANMVGTATETIIRSLHNFIEEGFITTAGRKITIVNPQGLLKVSRSI